MRLFIFSLDARKEIHPIRFDEMRLFESIIDANHKAVAGDASAGLRPADFENELPIIALTCIDPRLNAFFPNVLGVPGETRVS